MRPGGPGLKRITRRLSLKHRLLALTLAAAVPGLLALAYNAFDLRNTRRAEVQTEVMRNTRFAVSEIEQVFGGARSVLQTVALAAELRADENTCSDYVGRVAKGVDALTAIFVTDRAGAIRCASDSPLPTANLGDRPYFQKALEGKPFVIGNYVQSRASGRFVVPLAVPLLVDNAVTGVVVAGLNLKWLGDRISYRAVPGVSAITIADENGVIVWREPRPEAYVGTRVAEATLSPLAGATGGITEIADTSGHERIFGYVPAGATSFGLSVATDVSKDAAFRGVDDASKRSLLLFALGSLGALVLAWMTGEGMIRQPLMKVVATAEAWRRGHDMVRTGIIDRDDEIGLLGQTFDRLMDENQQREAEREAAEARRDILIRELAHRVKNTLATVQSIASLSFRDSQGPDALRGFHERLQALVRSHDLLTRHNWERADITDILDVALAPLRENRSERFVLNGPAVELPATTAVAVAMILHELCTNAVKYGALSNQRGSITIRWAAIAEPRGTAVSLTWSESGGPPVERPAQEGFGTRLMESLTRQMSGGFEPRYAPSGLVCHIRFVSPSLSADAPDELVRAAE